MKKTTLNLIPVLTFMIFATACNSPSQNQNQGTAASEDSLVNAVSQTHSEIKISFPKGGEEFVKGKTYTLKWDGGDSTVTIFLVDSSLQSIGVSVSLSDRKYHVKNTGSYDYTFPERLEEGIYKFEIGNGSSGYFEVTSE